MKTMPLSTVECAKYNEQNAPMIEAGLMEAYQPNPEILAYEERCRREEERAAAERNNRCATLKAVWQELPARIRALYKEPVPTTYSCPSLEQFSCGTAPRVQLDSYTHRLNIGEKWVKLERDNSLTPQAKAKAVDKIADELVCVEAANARQNNERQAAARMRAFIETNPELCKAIGLDAWTKWATVEPDGKLAWNGIRGTAAQWQQVAELKAKHAAELKALTSSF